MKKAAEYFVIFLMIQFVSLTLANGAVMLTGGKVGDNLAGTAIGMSVANFILVVAVFMVWLRNVRFSTGYIKQKPYSQLLCCAVLGVATIAPSLYLQQIMPEVADSNEELFKSVIASPFGFISLVFLGPVTEEIVYRGAILGALTSANKNQWVAVLVSALLFAVSHFNPAQFTHALLIGALLGWICIKTKSILPCIVIHIINNGMAFAFIKYFPGVSFTSAPLLIISAAAIIISLWGMVKLTARQ